MKERKYLDVVVYVESSSADNQAQVTSLTLAPVVREKNSPLPEGEIKHILYIERTDLDQVALLSTDIGKELDSKLLLKDHLEFESTEDDSELPIVFYKNHDINIQRKLDDWVHNYLRNKEEYELRFWTVNPMDWQFFLNLGFYSINGYYQVKEGVNMYPLEVNSLVNYTLDTTQPNELYNLYLAASEEDLDNSLSMAARWADFISVYLDTFNPIEVYQQRLQDTAVISKPQIHL